MPLYIYRCNSCGHAFEKLLPVSRRDDEQTCPVCEESDVKRDTSSFSAAVTRAGSCSGGSFGFT